MPKGTEDKTHSARDGMFTIISFKVLLRILIVLPKLPHNILAHIAIILLHLACNLQLVFRRHIHHFTALTHQVENELRNVTPCDGDVLDRTPDNVPLCAGDDMRDPVTGVDDGSGKRSIGGAAGDPRRCECEHGLDSNVKSFDVKRLKENFSCLFSVFGRVERRLGLEHASSV